MNFKRNIIIWLAIILGAVIVFDIIQKRSGENVTDLSFSDFLNKVEKKEVSSVVIRGHNVEGKLSDGKDFITYIPNYPNLVDVLKNNKVAITAAPIETKMSSFITMIISWLPMILLIGVWIFFMRQMGAGAGKAMGFGRSRAQMQGSKLAKRHYSSNPSCKTTRNICKNGLYICIMYGIWKLVTFFSCGHRCLKKVGVIKR